MSCPKCKTTIGRRHTALRCKREAYVRYFRNYQNYVSWGSIHIENYKEYIPKSYWNKGMDAFIKSNRIGYFGNQLWQLLPPDPEVRLKWKPPENKPPQKDSISIGFVQCFK